MSDLISRQAALNAFDCTDELIVCGSANAQNVMNYINKVIGKIKALPSAQPTHPNTPNTLKTLDCISRQAAIEAVDDVPYIKEHPNIGLLWKAWIKQLPSAQLSLDEWCHDCKEYDHENHYCPRWNRVIRNALKDAQPEIIRCKECMNHGKEICYFWSHFYGTINTPDDGFCHKAERRTDD